MSRKSQPFPSDQNPQLPLNFDEVIRTAEVFSRDDIERKALPQDYDPISLTTEYMKRTVQFEEAWETTIQRARKSLLMADPREIYFNFLTDLKQQIDRRSRDSAKLGHLLEQVAIRGFGMSRNHLVVESPAKGRAEWKILKWDAEAIRQHLEEHILGKYFLNQVSFDEVTWKGHLPLIGASDVSQHRSAVPIPARFFRRSVPFVLNNAAGTLFQMQDGQPKYEKVFNPRPDEILLRWMLIDPSYQDELEPEDYERCVASAMDVGQYKFDHEYLLKADKRVPDVIFRDGSLFPQDAYLDNYVIQSRRGEFTREAIRELLNCLLFAKAGDVIYCGVSKNVQLKVYSAVVDWYIARHLDRNWEFGNYTLNDGQAMSLLLSTPEFVGNQLQSAVATCLIRRSFTTRANLNTRTNPEDLEPYFRLYEYQHQECDITYYKQVCDMANVYMFFIGHSKSPQQQLPRYEFYIHGASKNAPMASRKILASIQHCGLMNDEDHSFMADKLVTYLLPSVTQHAHLLSKDVGKYIDTETGQWIMARYRSLLSKTT
jgi:hypothetical protein